jgi:hypothetical protein
MASWQRRVIPEGYARVTLTLSGTSPLLMNSGEVDRDSELFRAYYMLGQKKRKTLDDEARLRELEWQLRLYLDADLGPYVPGKNVKELLRSAATKWRRGEDIKRSLVVEAYRIPLTYDGFRYTAMVANAGMGSGRVLRCRPMLPKWSLSAAIAYDPEEIDGDFLALVVERSQKYGLGDYRPEFGSFKAELSTPTVTKRGAQGDATKPRDHHREEANDAMSARILVASK